MTGRTVSHHETAWEGHLSLTMVAYRSLGPFCHFSVTTLTAVLVAHDSKALLQKRKKNWRGESRLQEADNILLAIRMSQSSPMGK